MCPVHDLLKQILVQNSLEHWQYIYVPLKWTVEVLDISTLHLMSWQYVTLLVKPEVDQENIVIRQLRVTIDGLKEACAHFDRCIFHSRLIALDP